ncbi:MAG: hypothetical protein ACRD22_04305, partial [Terriglobia bacterium]
IWILQGIGHLLQLSASGSAPGWIQSHWFFGALFWFLLFAIVCGLFRLGRPVLQWHRAAVSSLADAMRRHRRSAPEIAEGM